MKNTGMNDQQKLAAANRETREGVEDHRRGEESPEDHRRNDEDLTAIDRKNLRRSSAT